MTTNDRPNIIYILGDDQRADMLGCAGHPVLQTPHLDALAAAGTRFTSAHCTSPLCTPSRACHYLGQWERRHGINFNSGAAVSPSAWRHSFPMLLKAAGYYTGWVGKNHVPVGENGYDSGHMDDSFDYWYGNHGHSTFYPKENGKKGEIYKNAALDTQVEVFAEGVRNFLQPDPAFLTSCSRPLPERDTSKPFALCVTFNLPHGASTSTMQLRPSDDEIYKSLYRDRFADFPLPATYRYWGESYRKLPVEVWNGEWIPSYDYVKTPPTLRELMVRQCQTVHGVDRFVGQLRAQLEELGLAENTIIVFSTDHGIHFGEHGIGGKSLLYREDLEIPCIIYDPRAPAAIRGQERDELVVVPDLAPTVLELCGLAAEERMQGTSLKPLLYGERPAWREAFFAENLFDHQNYPRCECVQTEEWKYVRYFRRSEDPEQAGKRMRGTLDPYMEARLRMLRGEEPIYEELYHLGEDGNEEHNLAAEPEHDAVLQGLRKKLQEHGQQALDGAEETDTVATQSSWASRATHKR